MSQLITTPNLQFVNFPGGWIDMELDAFDHMDAESLYIWLKKRFQDPEEEVGKGYISAIQDAFPDFAAKTQELFVAAMLRLFDDIMNDAANLNFAISGSKEGDVASYVFTTFNHIVLNTSNAPSLLKIQNKMLQVMDSANTSIYSKQRAIGILMDADYKASTAFWRGWQEKIPAATVAIFKEVAKQDLPAAVKMLCSQSWTAANFDDGFTRFPLGGALRDIHLAHGEKTATDVVDQLLDSYPGASHQIRQIERDANAAVKSGDMYDKWGNKFKMQRQHLKALKETYGIGM